MNEDERGVVRQLSLVRQLGLLVALVYAVGLMIGTYLGAKIGTEAWLLALLPLALGSVAIYWFFGRLLGVALEDSRKSSKSSEAFQKIRADNRNMLTTLLAILVGLVALTLGVELLR